MIKKAIIITSVIEPTSLVPFTYSEHRSFFGVNDRLRQTITTIASLDQISDEHTTIYLLDASENWQALQDLFQYQKNLKFVSVKNQFPDVFAVTSEHAQKSHCECLMLSTFMHAYRSELKTFDFVIKMSGRYFLDGSFDTSAFNKYNKSRIFYKTPLQFEWHDTWNYHMVDQRVSQDNNYLHQYSSVIYGFGVDYFDRMLDMITAVSTMLSQPQMSHYDIETLSYYFTRDFKNDIIETDWMVYGWDGPTGNFMRY